MSPWHGTRKLAEDGWHLWWAWRPVMIRSRKLPGRKVLTVFEQVWRRRHEGRWEYDLAD